MMSRNDRDRSSVKENPKILILGGGIEFQRTDTRLSSMDTLIEQEDSYISILVEKIMYVDRTYFLISCFGVSYFLFRGFLFRGFRVSEGVHHSRIDLIIIYHNIS